MNGIQRGDVFDVELPGLGRRPVVVITRQVAIPVLTAVTVAQVTSTVRGLRSEVSVGEAEGLDHECVVNCDNISTVPKGVLRSRRGTLDPIRLVELDRALRVALGLD